MLHQLVKFLLVFSAWSLVSCNGNIERLDTSSLKEEMENRKIKKISESDITLSVNKKGSEIEKMLSIEDCKRMTERLDSLKAITSFSLESLDMMTYSSDIEKEKEILEALNYAMENGGTFPSTYQKLSDTLYAFYFPLNSANCQLSSEKENGSLGKVSFKKGDIIRAF